MNATTNIIEKVKASNQVSSRNALTERNRLDLDFYPMELRDNLILNMRRFDVTCRINSLRFIFTVEKIPHNLPESLESGIFFPIKGGIPIIYSDCRFEDLLKWANKYDIIFLTLYMSAPGQAKKFIHCPKNKDKYNYR